jgi:hypothetical protein
VLHKHTPRLAVVVVHGGGVRDLQCLRDLANCQPVFVAYDL